METERLDYQFRTKPFGHQADEFLASRDRANYALRWEQGTGKTKTLIDTAAWLLMNDQVDGVPVIAPNGVHRNWYTDEIPVHFPVQLLKRSKMFVWNSSKADNVSFQQDANLLLRHDGPAWLMMSYDAVMTDKGGAFLGRFLNQRRSLLIADESHHIKSPNAKRTKRCVSLAKRAPFRRIATGTMITKGPFDIYSQVMFLDENFWTRRGISNFYAFKQRYGVWKKGYNSGSGQEFDVLVEYRNLDELERILSEIGSRVLKEDVLDLPPKLYSKRYHKLLPEQERVYRRLKEDFFVELADGKQMTAALAIVRLLRFQQIVCGYMPCDNENPRTIIPNHPRIKLLEETVEGLTHPAIIWARFTQDVDQIMSVLGDKAVRYDGAISDDECERSKLAFQSKDGPQYFVGNPGKGSEGLTLTRARTVIYYNNTFRLKDRLQSEDRAHRIGQDFPVEYIDMVCPDTVDEKYIDNLRGKFDIASQLNGDRLREWL